MSLELKIKAKHLALEPAIIRKEEHKLLKQIKHIKSYHQVNDNYGDLVYPIHKKWYSLHNHRKWDVRNEARATHLARAFIKGIPYKSVEFKRNEEFLFKTHIVPRIFAMVAKYGNSPIRKYWNGKENDFKPEEKKILLDSILEWSKIEE